MTATEAASTIDSSNLSEGFDEAATRYDLMVALNPGYHRHLTAASQRLTAMLPAGRRPGPCVDLGCGSGASTRALLHALEQAGASEPRIVGIDASAGMLAQARAKSWPADVTFEVGVAQQLSAERERFGLSERQSGVLAAYLFRNVDERDHVLEQVRDLLDDDGVLVVQEYSVADSLRAKIIWTLVCWAVVIPLSAVLLRRTRLYRYLWRSVLEFDAVPVFLDRLQAAGFTDIAVETVPGWQRGILHTFSARKPPSRSS